MAFTPERWRENIIIVDTDESSEEDSVSSATHRRRPVFGLERNEQRMVKRATGTGFEENEVQCIFVNYQRNLYNPRISADFYERVTPPRSPVRKTTNLLTRSNTVSNLNPVSLLEGPDDDSGSDCMIVNNCETEDLLSSDFHECETPLISSEIKKRKERRSDKQKKFPSVLATGNTNNTVEEQKLEYRIQTKRNNNLGDNVAHSAIDDRCKTNKTKRAKSKKLQCDKSQVDGTTTRKRLSLKNTEMSRSSTVTKKKDKHSKELKKTGIAQGSNKNKRRTSICDICRRKVDNVTEHILNDHANFFV